MAGVQAAWGIDVGVSSLKAIKLRRDGDRVTIEAFDVIEHDRFLSEEGVDRDALIRSTLQKFVTKYGIRNDVVFIGVPGSTTFARFVKLPPVETKKIPEIVRFEAIQQIPFPLDQVNWDYHTFQHPDSPDVEVGIFAMKKELVAQIMSNFRAANLNVQGVQMSPLAVYNAAAYDGMTGDKGTVVIDMGAEHTDIVIMDQGRVWLRSIGIGGNHFTDALAKSFKQQFSKAEKLKKEAATSKYQKQIYQAMRPIFADLVAEIQRSLGAYNSSHRDSRLERIVGMGNPFKLPNLQKYLQQELKMEVVRLETFKQANIEKAAAFSENILSMSTAYGLAIQALGQATIDTNLLPTEIARQMMWKKKTPWFIAASAILVVGCLTNVGRWYADKSAFAAAEAGEEHDTNDTHASDNKKLLDEWNGISNNYNEAAIQVRDQVALVAARRIWPAVYSDIFAALPARGNAGPILIITDISSRYTSTLLSEEVKTATGMAAGASGGATPGSTTTPPAGTPGAPTVKPGDHGYMVTISGYARSSQSYDEAKGFLQRIMTKSQPPAAATQPAAQPASNNVVLGLPDKLYYYDPLVPPTSQADWKLGIGGHQIKPTTPAGGGGSGFGGMGGGGSATSAPEDQPWGKTKGPFWDYFFTDITGYKPPAVSAGPGQPAQEVITNLDLPYPIDLVGTRLTGKLTPMGGIPGQPQFPALSTFSVTFKVHIRDEVK